MGGLDHINLEYIAKDKPLRAADISVPRRNLAGARQLVDESTIEELDDKLARVTLLQWLK